jgi:DNA-binding response OmpR family regulator
MLIIAFTYFGVILTVFREIILRTKCREVNIMAFGRIILTDDDRNMRTLMYNLLTKAGFQVTSTTESGLNQTMLNRQNADAAVLSITPKSRYCREILGRNGKSPDIPVIVLLPQEISRERIDYLTYGADDVLIKPIDIAELTAKLHSLIRRDTSASVRSSPSPTAEVGGLSVDLFSYTANVGGKEIVMPPKEIEILHLLLLNPNRVFRRGEIAAQIWGQNLTNDRTVDSHINRIKRLIGKPYSDMIVSVRGIGYKFTTEKEKGEDDYDNEISDSDI